MKKNASISVAVDSELKRAMIEIAGECGATVSSRVRGLIARDAARALQSLDARKDAAAA